LAKGGDGGSGIVILRYVPPAPLSAYEQWLQVHFTTDQLTNSAISGDSADPDQDGLNNQQEYWAGTNPTNGLSCLILYAPDNNVSTAETFVVRWQSASNRWYTVQTTTNLSGVFSNLAIGIIATPTVNVYTDTVAGAEMKFYRVQVSPVE